MRCTKTAIKCREKDIAAKLGLTPRQTKPWQFEGKCPVCAHGGFSIIVGDQGHDPLRHIWCCNCRRCHCDAVTIRKRMLDDGIPDGCLGGYKRKELDARLAATGDGTGGLRAAMAAVLRDDSIRALADLKLRMAEVLWGDAPEDWDGFVAFAERAGVSRSKRYEAAARWGRQRQ
jgi:hypothetical protein